MGCNHSSDDGEDLSSNAAVETLSLRRKLTKKLNRQNSKRYRVAAIANAIPGNLKQSDGITHTTVTFNEITQVYQNQTSQQDPIYSDNDDQNSESEYNYDTQYEYVDFGLGDNKNTYNTISYKEGKRFTKFPNVYGYKICSDCDNGNGKRFRRTTSHEGDKDTVCKTCSGNPKNFKGASLQNLNVTAFADLLALTALDLTAPASDAILRNRKNAWIQLAGHPGAFAPAGPNTIWKKRYTKDNNETKAYEALMEDSAHVIVPLFYREVEYNGEYFIEMEDLLQHFHDPNIMDIKMGQRTFLESEVKNPVLRKDLYEKMISLDPDAPTDEERENQAITKMRYMQFREQESSSSMYGFRIEALRISGEPPNTNLKKVKTKEQIQSIICKFLNGCEDLRHSIIKRLEEIQRVFEESAFMKTHEVVGSSILVMHDSHKAGAWVIDFSKTVSVESGDTVNHRSPWIQGNHEDGFLIGLDNLIQFFTELTVQESKSSNSPVKTATTDTPDLNNGCNG